MSELPKSTGIPEGEIHLYFTRPDKIDKPGLLSRYKSLLTRDELQDLSRFHFPQHKKQYLLTRALVRTCLSIYHDTDPDQWRFAKDSHGKPKLAKPFDGLPVGFNLSHTDGLIICAIVSGSDIGVDVENRHRPMVLEANDFHRFLSPVEIRTLEELPPEEKKHGFFDYWTLKESYLKAAGMDRLQSLHEISFILKNNKLVDVLIQHENSVPGEHWKFWRVRIDDQYLIAVAMNSGFPEYEFKAFNVVPLESVAASALFLQ